MALQESYPPQYHIQDTQNMPHSEKNFKWHVLLYFPVLCFIFQLPVRITILQAKISVNSFVISRVDYCNYLLVGVPRYQLDRLQSVMNTAAAPRSRIISSTCCATAFIGFPSHSASSSSCVCWRTRRCMDWHRRTSPTSVDQSQPSAADKDSDPLLVAT